MVTPTTKKAILITILLVVILTLAGCSVQPGNTATTETTAAVSETTTMQAAEETATPVVTPTATPQAVTLKVFNAEELAKYNGQNGNRAYVAVDGKVYDVTDVPQWKNGTHFGKYQAGVDLTEEIKTVSPHGVSKLDSVPIVGLYEP